MNRNEREFAFEFGAIVPSVSEQLDYFDVKYDACFANGTEEAIDAMNVLFYRHSLMHETALDFTRNQIFDRIVNHIKEYNPGRIRGRSDLGVFISD